jgi:hypothetical protein
LSIQRHFVKTETKSVNLCDGKTRARLKVIEVLGGVGMKKKSAFTAFTPCILAGLLSATAQWPAQSQGTVTSASRYGLVAEYQARISRQDKYNSSGQRLTSVAQILRQDRANFHALGSGDGEDTYDSYFANRANRASLERLIRNSSVSRSAASLIINGTPLATVRIYRDAAGYYVRVVVQD